MKFWKNLNLAFKIGTGFGVVLIVTVGLGALAVLEMDGIRESTSDLPKKALPLMEHAHEFQGHLNEVRLLMREFQYTLSEGSLEAVSKELVIAADSIEALREVAKQESIASLEASADELEATRLAYLDVVERTKEARRKIEAARAGFSDAAIVYFDSAAMILNMQKEALQAAVASNKQAEDAHSSAAAIMDTLSRAKQAIGDVRSATLDELAAEKPELSVEAMGALLDGGISVIMEAEKQLAKLGKDFGSGPTENILNIASMMDRVDRANQLGNDARSIMFQAQALQNPEILQEGIDKIGALGSLMVEASKEANDEDLMMQLDAIQVSVESFQESLNQLYEQYMAMDVLANERNAIADTLIQLTGNLVEQGTRVTDETVALSMSELGRASSILKVGLLLAIGIGVIASLIITRQITKPVSGAVRMIESMASGDLTQRCEVEQNDEIGKQMQALNKMGHSLGHLIQAIIQNAQQLSSSSQLLTDTATQLTEGADKMSDQSSSVAEAGEELSGNITTIAATSEKMSSNLDAVASAVEEMSASINEVASSCSRETQLAKEASDQANEAKGVMSALGEAATEISQVVELINNIADQTNLLALNATIEAASAGEAGKGFAVVANEVKALARQTADATEQIRAQIETIQSRTQDSVSAIESVTVKFGEVSRVSQSIASAVDQQSSTTNEISLNLTDVSAATREMAQRVQQLADGAEDVSMNIQGIRDESQKAASGAAQTNESSQSLNKMASSLKELVASFKV